MQQASIIGKFRAHIISFACIDLVTDKLEYAARRSDQRQHRPSAFLRAMSLSNGR